MNTTCNRPAVKDADTLSRLLRRRWLGVPGLHIEICDNKVNIYGQAWPSVYRIPDGIDWSLCWPGKPDLGEPIDIDGLLTDIGPYLIEQLIVYTTGDRKGRWSVMPGQTNVIKSIEYEKPTRDWLSMHPANEPWGRGRNGYFVARWINVRAINVRPEHSIYLAVYSRRLGTHAPIRLTLSRRDALELGLALVQGTAGNYDYRQLQQAFDAHAFLIEEFSNGEEPNHPRDPGHDHLQE